jgi:hypothetical protein
MVLMVCAKGASVGLQRATAPSMISAAGAVRL